MCLLCVCVCMCVFDGHTPPSSGAFYYTKENLLFSLINFKYERYYLIVFFINLSLFLMDKLMENFSFFLFVYDYVLCYTNKQFSFEKIKLLKAS